jgi:hypothetical protein
VSGDLFRTDELLGAKVDAHRDGRLGHLQSQESATSMVRPGGSRSVLQR